jgi:hypothetical protein
MNPLGIAFLVEFFKTVLDELTDALKRRRKQKEKEAQAKRIESNRQKQAAIERAVYDEYLAEMKKKSKIPENPYAQ